jgi:hypothetical protein
MVDKVPQLVKDITHKLQEAQWEYVEWMLEKARRDDLRRRKVLGTGISSGTIKKGQNVNSSTNPKDKVGQAKPQTHLIPPVARQYEAAVMRGGADQYGPLNWRDDKIALSTYISAIQRHLDAFTDGETLDRKSGLPHMAHVRANTSIMLDAMEQGTAIDDRSVGKTADVIDELTADGENIQTTIATDQLTEEHDWDNLFSRELKKMTPPPGHFYIAGPMRGKQYLNFPAFDEARDRGLQLGHTITSPADLDREVGIDVYTEMDELDLKACISRDLQAIIRLTPGRDGLAVLPGWENSTGAVAEIALANWIGLKVVSATDFETPLTHTVKQLVSGWDALLRSFIESLNQ